MLDLIKSPRQILMDETGLPQLETGLLNNTQPYGVQGHATGGAIDNMSAADMLAAMIYGGHMPPHFQYAVGGSVDFPSAVEPTHMAGGGVIDKALPHVGHAFALDPLYELAKAIASQKWGHALQSAGDLAQVYSPMKAALPAQLATYSPELNSNEDAELAARRAMPPLSTIQPNR